MLPEKFLIHDGNKLCCLKKCERNCNNVKKGTFFKIEDVKSTVNYPNKFFLLLSGKKKIQKYSSGYPYGAGKITFLGWTMVLDASQQEYNVFQDSLL